MSRDAANVPAPTVRRPADRTEWLTALDGSAEALAFHTPDWIAAICESGPYTDETRVFDFGDGRRLVLPLVRRRTRPRSFATSASLPYGWGFGGLVGPGMVDSDEAAAALAGLGGEEGRTSVRPNPLAAAPSRLPDSVAVTPIERSAYVLPLDRDFEDVQRRFSGSGRRSIRKAEEASLTVEADSSGRLVSVFYELYLKSAERWTRGRRVPALARARLLRRDPLRKFEVVAKRMGAACRIWVASLDQRPAAAIIVLTQGANASYWRGAMDHDVAAPTRANFLLHSRAIEHACQSGCRNYHMGETDPESSLARFKAQFGAEAHRYFEYRLERPARSGVRARVRLRGRPG